MSMIRDERCQKNRKKQKQICISFYKNGIESIVDWICDLCPVHWIQPPIPKQRILAYFLLANQTVSDKTKQKIK